METNNMINVSDDTSTAIAKDEMVKSGSVKYFSQNGLQGLA